MLGSPREALAAATRVIAEHPFRIEPHALIAESFYYLALALAALVDERARARTRRGHPRRGSSPRGSSSASGSSASGPGAAPTTSSTSTPWSAPRSPGSAGSEPEAIRLYEQAISSAREGGFVQHEAIACELAAGFYRARGLVHARRRLPARGPRRLLPLGRPRQGGAARSALPPPRPAQADRPHRHLRRAGRAVRRPVGGQGLAEHLRRAQAPAPARDAAAHRGRARGRRGGLRPPGPGGAPVDRGGDRGVRGARRGCSTRARRRRPRCRNPSSTMFAGATSACCSTTPPPGTRSRRTSISGASGRDRCCASRSCGRPGCSACSTWRTTSSPARSPPGGSACSSCSPRSRPSRWRTPCSMPRSSRRTPSGGGRSRRCKANQATLQAIVDNSAAAIYLKDREGRYPARQPARGRPSWACRASSSSERPTPSSSLLRSPRSSATTTGRCSRRASRWSGRRRCCWRTGRTPSCRSSSRSARASCPACSAASPPTSPSASGPSWPSASWPRRAAS